MIFIVLLQNWQLNWTVHSIMSLPDWHMTRREVRIWNSRVSNNSDVMNQLRGVCEVIDAAVSSRTK